MLKASIGEIVFAPDDPSLVYAAVGNGVAISHNAGQTWNVVKVGTSGISALHVAVAPREPSGIRRVYAAGGNEIFYSTDGGTTWRFDPGTSRITSTRQPISDFQVGCQIAAGQTPEPAAILRRRNGRQLRKRRTHYGGGAGESGPDLPGVPAAPPTV